MRVLNCKGTLKVLKVLLKVLIVSQTIGIFPESTFSTLIYIKLIELNYYVVVELIVVVVVVNI